MHWQSFNKATRVRSGPKILLYVGRPHLACTTNNRCSPRGTSIDVFAWKYVEKTTGKTERGQPDSHRRKDGVTNSVIRVVTKMSGQDNPESILGK